MLQNMGSVAAVAVLMGLGLLGDTSAALIRGGEQLLPAAKPRHTPSAFVQASCVPDPNLVSFMAVHYAWQHPVVNYHEDCTTVSNAPCLSDRKYGCSLYQMVKDICANVKEQQPRCHTKSFVYSDGFAPGHHVVGIPFDPIRGMEDIEHNVKHNAEISAGFFQTMWQELVAGTAGTDLKQGFSADKGGIVINPPAHREYHQMHFHGGTYRTPVFENCLSKMTSSPNWQLTECQGLSEGGASCGGTNPCQTAVLVFRTVDTSKGELGNVWTYYNQALEHFVPPHTKVDPKDMRYHAAVMVTRGPQLKATPSLLYVIVYAPVDEGKNNGLGRGHFLCSGKEGQGQC